ncbi:hypothetical protein CLV94_2374 [Flavobacterium endophyticum]|uniref:Uncharacterized protein n=1 Tax=Flavobacterium endophyticum TaxID=1540163 RepID=A0A495MBW1_9FLAO|nr:MULTISPECIES: hypothetical protein [Flavobacterium]RKS21739.1 hypothetical protein CLV94_2374 [Flavobacterium endophyticum]WDO14565.1 hypothetical protein MH928_07665 [Flavobacterium sp. WW92]
MNKILILCAYLFPTLIFSQTKLDENVSVSFSGKTETYEHKEKNAIAKAYFFNSKEDSYVAMRVGALSNGVPDRKLPKDIAELKNIYQQVIAEQLKSMAKKGLFLKDSTQISVDKHIAYKLRFKGKDSEQEVGESLILYIEGITYVFIYSKVGSYSIDKKEKFFKSIRINTSSELQQISKPFSYSSALLKIVGSILFLFLLSRLIKLEKNRNKN